MRYGNVLSFTAPKRTQSTVWWVGDACGFFFLIVYKGLSLNPGVKITAKIMLFSTDECFFFFSPNYILLEFILYIIRCLPKAKSWSAKDFFRCSRTTPFGCLVLSKRFFLPPQSLINLITDALWGSYIHLALDTSHMPDVIRALISQQKSYHQLQILKWPLCISTLKTFQERALQMC